MLNKILHFSYYISSSRIKLDSNIRYRNFHRYIQFLSYPSLREMFEARNNKVRAMNSYPLLHFAKLCSRKG